MKIYLLAACICLAHSETQAQQKDTLNYSLGTQRRSGGIALNQLGVCTIKLKDGTRFINCAIKEIKSLWVVYQKDKALHDLTIERIKCIVPENENFVIWFDDKNKAVTGSACP